MLELAGKLADGVVFSAGLSTASLRRCLDLVHAVRPCGGSQNLLRSVQSAGLGHLEPVLASTDDP
jgi:hypothetical protein